MTLILLTMEREGDSSGWVSGVGVSSGCSEGGTEFGVQSTPLAVGAGRGADMSLTGFQPIMG
jgi:hypothetical protein